MPKKGTPEYAIWLEQYKAKRALLPKQTSSNTQAPQRRQRQPKVTQDTASQFTPVALNLESNELDRAILQLCIYNDPASQEHIDALSLKQTFSEEAIKKSERKLFNFICTLTDQDCLFPLKWRQKYTNEEFKLLYGIQYQISLYDIVLEGLPHLACGHCNCIRKEKQDAGNVPIEIDSPNDIESVTSLDHLSSDESFNTSLDDIELLEPGDFFNPDYPDIDIFNDSEIPDNANFEDHSYQDDEYGFEGREDID